MRTLPVTPVPDHTFDPATQRAAIMRVLEQVNDQRLKMLDLIRHLNECTRMLVQESDRLAIPAFDAIEANRGTRVRRVTYGQPGAESTTGQATPAEEIAAAIRTTGKPKRVCSVCRKPGHRKTTCPEAYARKQRIKLNQTLLNEDSTAPQGRKRRACSICRQPGHWAKNCPSR